MPNNRSITNKRQPACIALVGNPNSGKTSLFNRLTGAKQKVANYAGVTVERKEGYLHAADMSFKVIDLPGTYSLGPLSQDEAITQEVLQGSRKDGGEIDQVVLVADANNLRRNLHLLSEIKTLGYPVIFVLNMMDTAKKRGMEINSRILSEKLDVPVIETVATRAEGIDALITAIKQQSAVSQQKPATNPAPSASFSKKDIDPILEAAVTAPPTRSNIEDRLDAFVLHPFLGYLILAGILFGMFQAVYSWSELPMEWIEISIEFIGEVISGIIPDGILKSLVVDGIVAGVGSMIIFLPQILILFLFILILEESGYLPRAAFLLDRLMHSVGLSGRSFIPLLSCFACAIPGIMATRTIQDSRSRLITIMVAPLMTCAARLPVYLLVIGAFIPNEKWGIFNLQGLVLFALYIGGIVSAMIIALLAKFFVKAKQYQPLIMELPAYHWPNPRNLLLGLWERGKIFVCNAGTIILALMVILWFLSTFPGAPENATEPAIRYSLAGQIGDLLQYIFAPIGFNWQLSIALIPGMAAREASVAALGTIYALSETGDQLSTVLSSVIATAWGLPTALSVLTWYVFAPQCIPMIIVTKRETNSWKYAGIMTIYLFALAYVASFAVYHISRLVIGG